MISYTLNNTPISYDGGGITSKTITTTEDSFYSTLDNTLDSMGIVGQAIDGAMSLLGLGPEDWESVKARADQGVINMINYGMKLMTENPNAQTLTLAFKYWALEVARLNYYRVEYTSSNSSNSIAVQIKGLEDFQSQVLPSIVKSFTYKTVTKSNTEGLKSLGQNAFPVNNVTYKEFVKKSGTKTPVQTVDLTGNPVTDVGTGVPTTDVNIPTDSPYFEDKPKENEGSFNWLYVIIPLSVGILYKVGQWAYKKLKK